MDIEIEQKGNKIEFLGNKIGLPDSKVIEKMNKLRIKKITSKWKEDIIMDKLFNSPNIHNDIKETMKLKFFLKLFCSGFDLFVGIVS